MQEGMMRWPGYSLRFATFVFLISTMAQPGFAAGAACLSDSRSVSLDKEARTALLHSHLCRPQSGGSVRVEFYRFSDMASSLIATNVKAKLLEKTIGKPELVENEILKTFRDLLEKYGESGEWSPMCAETATEFSVNGGKRGDADGMPVCETIGKAMIRTLTGATEEERSRDYPNVSDAKSLLKREIPEGMHFAYTAFCADVDSEPGGPCSKYEEASITFWRYLRASDVSELESNLKAYNRVVSPRYGKLKGQEKQRLDRYLTLVAHLAGSQWPDHFLTLDGLFVAASGDCMDENVSYPIGYKGWAFSFKVREPSLEAVLVRNAGTSPVMLSALLGARSNHDTLAIREKSLNSAAAGSETIPIDIKIAPGATLLIPTGIAFPVPKSETEFVPPSVQADYFRLLGLMGYKGATSGPTVPELAEYAFGPQISVSGLEIEGEAFDFSAPSRNAVNITTSGGAGSCPYLLSYDPAARDWVTHGKVLHEASGEARSETEERSFDGFRGRFRIEEREPELATIDKARLTVIVRGGRTLTLAPDDPTLAHADRNALELHWGEAAEIEFKLPHGVAEGDVERSHLQLTGYYRRYPALTAQRFGLGLGQGTGVQCIAEP